MPEEYTRASDQLKHAQKLISKNPAGSFDARGLTPIRELYLAYNILSVKELHQ
jgi:hypothetical protein